MYLTYFWLKWKGEHNEEIFTHFSWNHYLFSFWCSTILFKNRPNNNFYDSKHNRNYLTDFLYRTLCIFHSEKTYYLEIKKVYPSFSIDVYLSNRLIHLLKQVKGEEMKQWIYRILLAITLISYPATKLFPAYKDIIQPITLPFCIIFCIWFLYNLFMEKKSKKDHQ